MRLAASVLELFSRECLHRSVASLSLSILIFCSSGIAASARAARRTSPFYGAIGNLFRVAQETRASEALGLSFIGCSVGGEARMRRSIDRLLAAHSYPHGLLPARHVRIISNKCAFRKIGPILSLQLQVNAGWPADA